MTQPQKQTPVSLCGTTADAVFGAHPGDQQQIVSALDEAMPLRDSSHADVVEYVVETPLRYAECFAVLIDGRKVGLRNTRQFVGWSAHTRDRSLLFVSNGRHYEVVVEAGLLGQAPGCVRRVLPEARAGRGSSPARKFIGIDGNLMTLPAARWTA